MTPKSVLTTGNLSKSGLKLCPQGLVVAVENSLALSIEEWRTLGFQRIVESPFVFRDQLKLNPYERPAATARDESNYVCNHCGEDIVIPIDLSQGSSQEFTEDCPICCRPNVIRVEIDGDGNVMVWAESEQNGE